jgi:poly-gamma-glutamate capsule biosynthesis protein CapA/YwtB (metallophosphatase superfamily)
MTVWLAATGDVVVQRPPEGCDPRLRELLDGAGSAFGNLEVPLTTRGTPAEKAATHRAHPDRAADVRGLGFDVVTLANNHMLDFGVQGQRDTVAAVTAAGLLPVGAGETEAEARRPVVRDGIAFLGLCSALPPGFAAAAASPGVAPVRVLQQLSVDPALVTEQPGMAPYVHTSAYAPDVRAACAAVREARAAADFVVVGIHWGVPFGFAAPSYGPLAEYQQPLGRALVDAGADLVVGHHPHMVQHVECYGGGLIAYSIGNYAFHSWAEFGGDFEFGVPAAPYRLSFDADETLDSVVLTVPVRPDAGVFVVRFVPTTMVGGDPVLPDPARAEAILRRLGPDVVLTRDDRLGIVGEVTVA